MRKKVLLFSLVAILLSSLTSCISAETVVERVTQSLHEIDTYQYDMNMTVNIAGVVDGEEGDATVGIDSTGTVDNINRRIWMEIELAVLMILPEEEEIEIGMEMYIIGNDSYMLIEAENETSPWLKERMPVGSWDETAKLNTDIAILEEAEVTLIGSEKIRGIDCYVLEISPSEEKLFDTVYQETFIIGEQISILTEELIRELIKNTSVKQWVQKDTSFLAKTEIAMEGEVPPGIMGDGAEGTLTVSITMTSLIFNYNKSVNIELPTEAEEAIPWDTDGFFEAGEIEAAATELANIQAAVHSLMVDNELAWLPNPVTVATNDMGAFPDTSATAAGGTGDKSQDPDGNDYELADQDGYYLYQHDITGDATTTGLVNYIATQTTTYWYSVDASGTVTQFTTSTQVPTQALEITPEIVQEKMKDIESIMDEAERMGIQVHSVVHEGESITLTCEAGGYITFREYVTALEESGRFATVTPPAEKFSYITGGTIQLEPNYQYIDMPAVYYEVNLALAPMTGSDAIAILVGIAEESGIDIDPNAGKLIIPSAAIRQVKAAGNTYKVLSSVNIQLKGDYEDVMAFISDLDSRKTLKTMILNRVLIGQVDVNGKTETTATVDVDIYTTES